MTYRQANFFRANIDAELGLHCLSCEHCKDKRTISIITCPVGKRVVDFTRAVGNLIQDYYVEFGIDKDQI
jgi:hypothetical protein